MSQTVTFTKVFEANGTSARGPWTRWDYKTEDGGRFPHFASSCEIPLNRAVNVQTSAKGDIKSWQVAGGSVSAGGQQTPASASEVASAAPTASQGHKRDFQAEAEGKTRCALVSALLPALFTAQVAAGGEPSPENARVLLEWAFKYVFSE